MSERLRILHAIHDFLPRHQAGSEIYTFELCRQLARRHHVTVLCAEFDPSRTHGHVTWRVHDGLSVVEIVNNWICSSFADTYRSPVMTDRVRRVLEAIQPHVVHVHNLLNLSFDLPLLARARGAAAVATLHDYTLVCASGGQRVHRAEAHLCERIEADRCARCFRESPFNNQVAFGRFAAAAGGRPGWAKEGLIGLKRLFPSVAHVAERVARGTAGVAVSPDEMEARRARAAEAFDAFDVVLAPSQSIADEFARLGFSRSRVRVSRYGFPAIERRRRPPPGDGPLRVGYVGTLVWHKGVHVLIEAVRHLPAANYELKIVGDPSVWPDYTAGLRQAAAGLPVRFMGRFDRTRIADAYADLDVLVVPSLWLENAPLVIHEAYMSGVPVIASRIGGHLELVDDGRNGLLYYPQSPRALASALQKVLDDRGLLGTFGSSLPAVRSITEAAEELEAIYRDLTNQELGVRNEESV